MLKNTWFVLGASTAIFVAGFSLGSLRQSRIVAHAQGKHVYELRTYTAPDGKLGELNTRFRDHTMRIFNKHGMKSVLYMTPQDAPDSQNTLDLRPRASEPRGGEEGVGRLRSRPGVEEGLRRIAGQRPDRQQGRVGVRRSDRLFADEVRWAYDTHRGSARAGARRWSRRPTGWEAQQPPAAGATIRASPASRSLMDGKDLTRRTPALRGGRALGVAQPRQGPAAAGRRRPHAHAEEGAGGQGARRRRERLHRAEPGPLARRGAGQALVQINVGFGGETKWMEKVTDAEYNGRCN